MGEKRQAKVSNNSLVGHMVKQHSLHTNISKKIG